jgi:hypothetical protein
MKPLNLFLGEIFEGRWEDASGVGMTRLVAEQVSHHPPATACYVWNEQHGVRVRVLLLTQLRMKELLMVMNWIASSPRRAQSLLLGHGAYR